MKWIVWVFFSFIFSSGHLWANVEITTNPSPDHIKPDQDLVETTISLPAKSEYEIIIHTPQSRWWVSTDFPVVEGTQLYHFRGFTEDGKVHFKTIYPIRGEYQIEVIAQGETHKLSLAVNENSSEITNMLIFLGFLFLIGMIGGQIFLRSSRAKTAMATLAMLGMLSVLAPTEQAHAHENQTKEPHQTIHWTQSQGDYSLDVRFDSAQAIVGKNVDFDIQLKKRGELLQTSIIVEIETFRMEDQTTLFKGQFTSKTGQMKQTLHYFDGAETKTTLTVKSLDNLKLSTGGIVDVAGIAPPTKAKFKAMTLLTLVVLGGMAVGFFLIPGRKMIGETIS